MFTVNSSIIARPDLIVGYAPIIQVGAMTGGAANAFDALDVSGMSNDYTLGVKLGDALGFWAIRALGVGEVEDGRAFVICDQDPTRVWVRIL